MATFITCGSCESAPITNQLAESMGFVQSGGGVKMVVNGSVMAGVGLNELAALSLSAMELTAM